MKSANKVSGIKVNPIYHSMPHHYSLYLTPSAFFSPSSLILFASQHTGGVVATPNKSRSRGTVPGRVDAVIVDHEVLSKTTKICEGGVSLEALSFYRPHITTISQSSREERREGEKGEEGEDGGRGTGGGEIRKSRICIWGNTTRNRSSK